MFEITKDGEGRLRLRGRLDATQVDLVSGAFERISDSCVLDLGELDYISSAGLGALFATQKRLCDAGKQLKLVRLKPHIRELFAIAGFDKIFSIE